MKEDQKICRFCFESETKFSKMINPCKCAGTSQWIHEKCLQIWLTQPQFQNNTLKCEICNYEYIVHKEGFKLKKHLLNLMKNRWQVLKIFLFLLILVGAIIILFEIFAEKIKFIRENPGFSISSAVIFVAIMIKMFICLYREIKKCLKIYLQNINTSRYHIESIVTTVAP